MLCRLHIYISGGPPNQEFLINLIKINLEYYSCISSSFPITNRSNKWWVCFSHCCCDQWLVSQVPSSSSDQLLRCSLPLSLLFTYSLSYNAFHVLGDTPPTRSTLKGVRIFSFLFFFFCFVCVCVCVWDSLECFSVIFLWIQYASYWLLPLQSVSVPSPFHDLCSSCRVTWICIGACCFCFLWGFRFSFFSSYSVYYFHFICFAPRFDYPAGSLSNT